MVVPKGSLCFPNNYGGGGYGTVAPLVYLSSVDGSFIGISTATILGEKSDTSDSGNFTTAFDHLYRSCSCVEYGDWSGVVYAGDKEPRANYAERFYVTGEHSVAGTPAVAIQAVSFVDASLIQTWELGHIIGSGGFAITGIASVFATPENTTAYYAITAGNGATLAQRKTVFRWDLVNDVALPDFVADGTRTVAAASGSAILVMRDDSVLVGWNGMGTVSSIVVRYDPSGAVVNTYTLDAAASTENGIYLNSALNDQSFWVSFYDSAEVVRIQQIQTSDGTVLADFSITNALKATVEASFGGTWQPDSGFFLTRLTCGATPAPTNGVTRYTRRLRTFPHVDSEHFQLFLSRLEFNFQRGVGLTTGQGSDPQFMLRVSTDGGRTFGPEKWLSIGKLGEYARRAVAWRVGAGRDFVFELTTSDPVFVALTDCFAQITKGSH